MAAVDGYRCARDERGLVGAEPKDGGGNLLCPSDPPHGHRRSSLTLRFDPGAFQMVCEDSSRRHDIYPNALVGVIKRSNFSQADDPCLPSDVSRQIGNADVLQPKPCSQWLLRLI